MMPLSPTHQPPEENAATDHGDLREALNTLERERIIEALQLTRGNKAKAARLLNITERMMGLRVKKYGIDSKQFSTKK
jgi:Nif-specific regulatory protein